MDIEEIRHRSDQIAYVAMADQEPELKQFKEGLTDCVTRHDKEIILQSANVKGFSENEMQLLKDLLIEGLGQKTRTVLTMFGADDPKAEVNMLYLRKV